MKKVMEAAVIVATLSTTILHAWLIYMTYYWLLNNCMCI